MYTNNLCGLATEWTSYFQGHERWQAACKEASAAGTLVYAGYGVGLDGSRGLLKIMTQLRRDQCTRQKLEGTDLDEGDRAELEKSLDMTLPANEPVYGSIGAARNGRNPDGRPHGGYLVYDPRLKKVVDFLTKAVDGAGMESIFLDTNQRITSGSDVQNVGRTGKEVLQFLKGLWVLVGPGKLSKRPGVLYADFASKCTDANGIEVTVFGSEAAARNYQNRIAAAAQEGGYATTSRDALAVAASVPTQITDEVIEGFGKLFHSSHMDGSATTDDPSR